jgi:hypothetical protein
MKKSFIVIGIASILGIVWYFSKKNSGKSFSITGSKQVSATYTGEDRIQGTYLTLAKGDTVKGILNPDGSLTYDYMTSYGQKTVTLPPVYITDIQPMF